ncbi:hypothetical protein [Thalassotalea sp. ND16A]|uniref:hypothetical protein n=1 Tax=Thalassotalea sp. ND16A TaxID=1535422 RepID=UPI00051A6CCA|nr:hypothetical protein [Thalassotalea sp. ND16A]KGJ98036.1 hypothetical protein ND16A_0841 [Thalassotalea sp. ND16A]
MHLSDQQLLQLTTESNLHLQGCAVCKQRAAVLQSVRQQLKQPPKMPDLAMSWQKIEQTLSQQEQQDQQTAGIAKVKKQASLWRYSSFALAATLLALLILPLLNITNVERQPNDEGKMLSSWIQESNQLQQQLEALIKADAPLGLDVEQVHYQLVVIDKKLQQAYLQNRPDNDKKQLWLRRKQIIETALKPMPMHVISI